jgi:hypothetical protein
MIWFGTLLVLILIARWQKVNASAIAAFGIALVAIGLVTVASACLLTEFLPRYAFPMWLLLLLSLYMLCGAAADLIVWRRYVGRRYQCGNSRRLPQL